MESLDHILAELDTQKAGWAHNQHCVLTGYCQAHFRNSVVRQRILYIKKNEKCIQLHEQESFLECNLTISIHTLKNLNCTAIKELLCTRLRRIIRCLELQHAAQRGWNQDYSKDFNNKYEMDKLHMTLPFHASKNNLSYCFIQVLRIKKI